MTTLLFPDNTVLVNFALVGRVDLFGELVDGRGAWTHTVAEECGRSAREVGLESLARMPDLLGQPLVASRQERTDALVLRQRLTSPGDADRKHYGEAECLAIILGREQPAAFVTDDMGARRLSRTLGVTTYSTWDLVRLAVRVTKLDDFAGWDMVQVLRAATRHVPGAPGTEPDYRAAIGR